MTTSEQRVRARKTRRYDDLIPERPAKSNRGRRDAKTSPEALLRDWVCEGQLDLFGVPGGQQE
ncbi:hypothetical protein [Nocardia sp. NPDC005825]|uniref:hypothetical protein n=1 Tax=unclassified Nocardia TaxID=2637762 RepID=UPI0033F0BC3E